MKRKDANKLAGLLPYPIKMGSRNAEIVRRNRLAEQCEPFKTTTHLILRQLGYKEIGHYDD